MRGVCVCVCVCVWFDRVCINCGMSGGYRRKLDSFSAHILVYFVLHNRVQLFLHACTDNLPDNRICDAR